VGVAARVLVELEARLTDVDVAQHVARQRPQRRAGANVLRGRREQEDAQVFGRVCAAGHVSRHRGVRLFCRRRVGARCVCRRWLLRLRQRRAKARLGRLLLLLLLLQSLRCRCTRKAEHRGDLARWWWRRRRSNSTRRRRLASAKLRWLRCRACRQGRGTKRDRAARRGRAKVGDLGRRPVRQRRGLRRGRWPLRRRRGAKAEAAVVGHGDALRSDRKTVHQDFSRVRWRPDRFRQKQTRRFPAEGAAQALHKYEQRAVTEAGAEEVAHS